jgi:hypothetical protein
VEIPVLEPGITEGGEDRGDGHAGT